MMEASSTTPIKKHFWTRTRTIVLVVAIGFLLRLWAAWQLPVDFDEPVYMENGYQYAQLIQQGDINGIIDYPGTSEHPPLVKLLYGLTYLVLGRGTDWLQALFLSRFVSAIFGTMAVLVIALIDPLAGGFMAVQTLLVKYTGQAYLEAVPLFFGLLSISLLLRAGRGRNIWFVLSALALGITGAGKYSYFPILFVILYLLIWEKHERIGNIFIYLFLAGITFFAFDPYLWHSPVQRLMESLSFHATYSQSAHVQEIGYPWYQPFIWVSRSHGFLWHEDVFFYMGIDGIIFLAALPGLWLEWKRRRWVVVWVVTGMMSLLLWPTKWPQYTLVVLPAFCLAASTAIRSAYEKLREQEMYWEWLHTMFPRPSRKYVYIMASLVGLIFVGAIASQVLIAINNIGWSKMSTITSGLPSNAINDLLALPDGRMLVATDGGAAFWRAASKDEVRDEWLVFDPGNSPLPGKRVLSLAQDQDGAYWFGTESGLARFDGLNWSVYRASDIGLTSEQVDSIEVDDQNRIWIGTLGGVAVFDGAAWKSFTQETSELVDNAVFSIAIESRAGEDLIWFGTLTGVSSFELSSNQWQTYSSKEIDIGWGGVADMMFDSTGVLWVCTQGGGINLWDGKDWSYIRVSNSKLPYSTIQTISELEPGVFWMGASNPNSAGGVLVKYDGANWRIYREQFTGYSGAETMTISKDVTGRYWFGTRTDGIDVYTAKK